MVEQTSPPAVSKTTAAFDWAIEEVDAGTKPALALTAGDLPHVAYMLEAMSGFVKSAVRNDAEWGVTTIAEGYFYGPLDIAIGPGDVVHVAYHDHQAPRFEQDKGDVGYAVLRDGVWSVDAAFDRGHDGWDNRIVVDSDGNPHMSAIDPREFGGQGVEYYRLDESGEWQVETVGTGPLTYKYATSIALDASGNPFISYHDQSKNALALAGGDASEWDFVTVDDEGETGLFSSMVIDETGRFHISYLQKTSDSSGVVKYATRGRDNTSWQIIAVDTLPGMSFGFIGARNSTSLAIDSDNNPWIAYSDEQSMKLAVWDGAEWRIETVVEADGRPLGQLVSLKLDSQDHPHLAFFEVTNKGPLEGVVKYTKGTPF